MFNRVVLWFLLFAPVLVGGVYIKIVYPMQREDLQDHLQAPEQTEIPQQEYRYGIPVYPQVKIETTKPQETCQKSSIAPTPAQQGTQQEMWCGIPVYGEKEPVQVEKVQERLLKTVVAAKDSVCCFLIILFTLVCKGVEKVFVPVVVIYAFKKFIVDPVNKAWCNKE